MACNSFPFNTNGCGCGNNGWSSCTWTLIIIAIVFIWIFCCNGGSGYSNCGNDCGC